MYAITSSRNDEPLRSSPKGISLELEFIKDIRCVLGTSLGARVHFTRVVPFHTALLVSSKRIPRQI